MAENWSRAWDVNGPVRDKTETLTIFVEMRPRREVGTSRETTQDQDVETETTTLYIRGILNIFLHQEEPVATKKNKLN